MSFLVSEGYYHSTNTKVIENNLLILQKKVQVSNDSMFVFPMVLPVMCAGCCTMFCSCCFYNEHSVEVLKEWAVLEIV